jgi:tryptophan-rich sensory protein
MAGLLLVFCQEADVVIWNRRDPGGLAVNLAIAVAVAALANGFVYFMNPAEDLAPPTGVFQPPGWVIGLVWVCLFVFLGTARWLLLRDGDLALHGTVWVWLLLLSCAAYPIYTAGLRNLAAGLGGNVATAALAVWVALRIRKTSIVAAGLVSTVALWVTFASFLILEQMKRQHS